MNPNPAARGVTLMALAMLGIPAMDVMAKLLAQEIPAMQVAWGRFIFQAVVLTPIALVLSGWRGMIPKRPGAQFLRGAMIACATIFFFNALRFLPVANAIAIFFVEPLIVTLMAAVFLKERVGWRRLVAILVGFFGALLIIRPSFTEVGWAAALPLGAAVCFSAYIIYTRSLSDDLGPIESQAVAAWAGTLVITLALGIATLTGAEWAAPVSPTGEQWVRLVIIGACAAVAHVAIAVALKSVSPAVVAPLQYLEIVSATILGWIVFRDFPDLIAWVGVAIIVGSGLYVIWRERRLGVTETRYSPE